MNCAILAKGFRSSSDVILKGYIRLCSWPFTWDNLRLNRHLAEALDVCHFPPSSINIKSSQAKVIKIRKPIALGFAKNSVWWCTEYEY